MTTKTRFARRRKKQKTAETPRLSWVPVADGVVVLASPEQLDDQGVSGGAGGHLDTWTRSGPGGCRPLPHCLRDSQRLTLVLGRRQLRPIGIDGLR